jgi:hypothetical protein
MLRARLRALQRQLAPAGSWRHKYLRTFWRRVRGGILFGPPRLTLLCPVDEGDRAALDATLDSVLAQIDRRWQLVLVGDRAADIHAALPRDARIVATTVTGGTASQLNAAAASAQGAFVAVIAAGDLLLPNAVRAIGRATAASAADIVYGDEMDASKPDWSPDLLLAFPYTGRICAIARDAVARLGGWTRRRWPPTTTASCWPRRGPASGSAASATSCAGAPRQDAWLSYRMRPSTRAGRRSSSTSPRPESPRASNPTAARRAFASCGRSPPGRSSAS